MRIKAEEKWMMRAVELAGRAGEGTRPNPRVGAILVKGGRPVGAGFHRGAGQPHAEAIAIQKAGASARGADLYVTLEPCSSHGRTPPCTGAIRRAGIKRVIFGSSDVDPKNAARSERILQQAGIQVVRGVLTRECDHLNEDYFFWTRTQQPWVILKLAMTLEGFLAVPGKKWITGPQARNEVQKIRAGCDAILVGAETVRRDNPRLTVRTRKLDSQPWRVVVTKSGRLPRRAKIFTDAHRSRTLVYRGGWSAVLRDLYRRGVCRLLVEGGAKTAAGLIAAGLVNEVVLFFAPESAAQGGAQVRGWAGWDWRRVTATGAGRDLCLRGTLKGAN
ncbi:MAG: bifunctional diaminohydroxyphosphoribosylaminopyrimidine deaminase/5-amino-6-(5-phosphoribosylamino)uracil reductase RibD [Candidatus Methylacidiphilales bacterium]